MMQMVFKSIILKSTVYRICGFLFFGAREAVLWGSFLRLLELNINGKAAIFYDLFNFYAEFIYPDFQKVALAHSAASVQSS